MIRLRGVNDRGDVVGHGALFPGGRAVVEWDSGWIATFDDLETLREEAAYDIEFVDEDVPEPDDSIACYDGYQSPYEDPSEP